MLRTVQRSANAGCVLTSSWHIRQAEIKNHKQGIKRIESSRLGYLRSTMALRMNGGSIARLIEEELLERQALFRNYKEAYSTHYYIFPRNRHRRERGEVVELWVSKNTTGKDYSSEIGTLSESLAYHEDDSLASLNDGSACH